MFGLTGLLGGGGGGGGGGFGGNSQTLSNEAKAEGSFGDVAIGFGAGKSGPKMVYASLGAAVLIAALFIFGRRR